MMICIMYLYQVDTLMIRRIMYDTWYASGRCIDDQEDHV
jgi:uncharacterized CHY-type Zn-finger protein